MGGSRGLSEAGIPSNPPLNCLWDALNSLTPTQSHPEATFNYATSFLAPALVSTSTNRHQEMKFQDAMKL